jgi:hypothetical protein
MIFLEILILVLLLVIGGFLVYLGLFLVRRESIQKQFFQELLDAIEEMGNIPLTPVITSQERPKTWEEKYEEELNEIQKRLKTDPGLVDLDEIKTSWGRPPAPNTDFQDGLTFFNKNQK